MSQKLSELIKHREILTDAAGKLTRADILALRNGDTSAAIADLSVADLRSLRSAAANRAAELSTLAGSESELCCCCCCFC